MSFRHLHTSAAGIRHAVRDNQDGTQSILSTQENDPILDHNEALANANDGYSPSREWRRAATIPLGLVQYWKEVEGWDAWDPNNAARLVQKLNDPEFRKLRTAPGRLGVSNGEIR